MTPAESPPGSFIAGGTSVIVPPPELDPPSQPPSSEMTSSSIEEIVKAAEGVVVGCGGRLKAPVALTRPECVESIRTVIRSSGAPLPKHFIFTACAALKVFGEEARRPSAKLLCDLEVWGPWERSVLPPGEIFRRPKSSADIFIKRTAISPALIRELSVIRGDDGVIAFVVDQDTVAGIPVMFSVFSADESLSILMQIPLICQSIVVLSWAWTKLCDRAFADLSKKVFANHTIGFQQLLEQKGVDGKIDVTKSRSAELRAIFLDTEIVCGEEGCSEWGAEPKFGVDFSAGWKQTIDHVVANKHRYIMSSVPPVFRTSLTEDIAFALYIWKGMGRTMPLDESSSETNHDGLVRMWMSAAVRFDRADGTLIRVVDISDEPHGVLEPETDEQRCVNLGLALCYAFAISHMVEVDPCSGPGLHPRRRAALEKQARRFADGFKRYSGDSFTREHVLKHEVASLFISASKACETLTPSS